MIEFGFQTLSKSLAALHSDVNGNKEIALFELLIRLSMVYIWAPLLICPNDLLFNPLNTKGCLWFYMTVRFWKVGKSGDASPVEIGCRPPIAYYELVNNMMLSIL